MLGTSRAFFCLHSIGFYPFSAFVKHLLIRIRATHGSELHKVWMQQRFNVDNGEHSSKSNQSASIRKHTSHLHYIIVHNEICLAFWTSIRIASHIRSDALGMLPFVSRLTINTQLHRHWYTSRLRRFCSETMNCMHSMRDYVRHEYCLDAEPPLAYSFGRPHYVRCAHISLGHKQSSNLFCRQVKLFRWIIRKFIYKILMVAIIWLHSHSYATSSKSPRNYEASKRWKFISEISFSHLAVWCLIWE